MMPDRVRLMGDLSTAQLLAERYRCADDIANFVISVDLSGNPGFFRFGNGNTCYGQCASGQTHESPIGTLHDVLDHVVIKDSSVHLPFDPEQIIDNLRAERYHGSKGATEFAPGRRLLRSGYYLLRPLMPVPIRKRLQKLYFRGWQQIQFPKWPVDCTVEQIHEKLLWLALVARQGKPIPFIWFWPEGTPSCTIVTHDVETQGGLDLCSQLMDLNDSFSIKTSFQIVPEGRYTVRDAFLQNVRNRGFEVNVHDLNHDGHLFNDQAEFIRRAQSINRHVRTYSAAGFRSAVMYRNIDWYEALEVDYDMSVPNVSHLDPQQGGCCTIMPFFIGNIVELPVTMTQDYSLFHVLGQYSTDLWVEQSSKILEKNGLLSVIAHPDYLDNPESRRVYHDLLVYLTELRSKGQTWIALPGAISTWWRQRRGMKLVADGASWRIEGEGHQFARLAYAVLDGDSIRYEVAPPRSAERVRPI